MPSSEFHEACRVADYDKVLAMIERGADVNARDSECGWTPLQFAIMFVGCEPVVKLLLDRGADVNKRTKDGRSLVYFMLNRACMMSCGGHDEADECYTRILGMLDEYGVDLHEQSSGGGTALHSAAGRGMVKMVDFLIDRGADLEAKNKNDETPLEWARENDCDDTVALLRAAGARDEVWEREREYERQFEQKRRQEERLKGEQEAAQQRKTKTGSEFSIIGAIRGLLGGIVTAVVVVVGGFILWFLVAIPFQLFANKDIMRLDHAIPNLLIWACLLGIPLFKAIIGGLKGKRR